MTDEHRSELYHELCTEISATYAAFISFFEAETGMLLEDIRTRVQAEPMCAATNIPAHKAYWRTQFDAGMQVAKARFGARHARVRALVETLLKPDTDVTAVRAELQQLRHGKL